MAPCCIVKVWFLLLSLFLSPPPFGPLFFLSVIWLCFFLVYFLFCSSTWVYRLPVSFILSASKRADRPPAKWMQPKDWMILQLFQTRATNIIIILLKRAEVSDCFSTSLRMGYHSKWRGNGESTGDTYATRKGEPDPVTGGMRSGVAGLRASGHIVREAEWSDINSSERWEEKRTAKKRAKGKKNRASVKVFFLRSLFFLDSLDSWQFIFFLTCWLGDACVGVTPCCCWWRSDSDDDSFFF